MYHLRLHVNLIKFHEIFHLNIDQNLPTRVRVILSDASAKKSFTSVAAGGTVMLACRSITADCTNIAVAVAIHHADELQFLYVFHHRWWRCVIFCVCKRMKEKKSLLEILHSFYSLSVSRLLPTCSDNSELLLSPFLKRNFFRFFSYVLSTRPFKTSR